MALTKKDFTQIKEIVVDVSSKQTEELAVIVAKEINRLDEKIDRVETKLDNGFKELKGTMEIHRTVLNNHEERITNH